MISFVFVRKFHIVDVTIAWIVIKLKPNDDILQGISKLDYYVKISVFQRDKIGVTRPPSYNLSDGNSPRTTDNLSNISRIERTTNLINSTDLYDLRTSANQGQYKTLSSENVSNICGIDRRHAPSSINEDEGVKDG